MFNNYLSIVYLYRIEIVYKVKIIFKKTYVITKTTIIMEMSFFLLATRELITLKKILSIFHRCSNLKQYCIFTLQYAIGSIHVILDDEEKKIEKIIPK